MNRRRFLRATTGSLSVSAAVAGAGCLGFGSDEEDSDAPQPVTDPTDDDEEAPDEVQESADQLLTAQREISTALGMIEDNLDSFDGVLDGAEVPMDADVIYDYSEPAYDALEAAEDGAEAGQLRMAEELEIVVEGLEEFALTLNDLETVVLSFNRVEQEIENLDAGEASTALEEFSTEVQNAYDQLGEAEALFTTVSPAVLEEADGLSTGRVDRAFSAVQNIVDYVFAVDEGMEEFIDSMPVFEDIAAATERGDLATVEQRLEDVMPPLDAAYHTFDGRVQDMDISYRQDIQALSCVSHQAGVAAEDFIDAIQAYREGDQSTAARRVMSANRELDRCNYQLIDDVFEDILNAVL